MKRVQLENRTELWNEIPLESPYCIFIDPSSVCNFKCKFCMNHKIKNPQIMNFDLYKKIIDDLNEFENPIKTIRLYGFGEPLLNKNFSEMVKYAKSSSKVLNVDTTTNASLLNKELNLKIIEAGLDRVNISIEGLNNKKYKDFTGKDIDFNDLVRNIEHFYKNKKDTIVFIKTIADNLTDEEKQLFFDIFDPISDGTALEYSNNCWYDTEIKQANKDIGIYGQPLGNGEKCSYIFYSFTVQSSGEVSLCFLDWNKQMLIGNLIYQTVKQVWDSKILKNIQINILKGNKNTICKKCTQLQFGDPVNIDNYSEEILARIKQ